MYTRDYPVVSTGCLALTLQPGWDREILILYLLHTKMFVCTRTETPLYRGDCGCQILHFLFLLCVCSFVCVCVLFFHQFPTRVFLQIYIYIYYIYTRERERERERGGMFRIPYDENTSYIYVYVFNTFCLCWVVLFILQTVAFHRSRRGLGQKVSTLIKYIHSVLILDSCAPKITLRNARLNKFRL